MAAISRTATQTATNINDLLEQRDILGLLTIAGGAAGGVILTQRLANRVLPLVGLSPTPQTITEGVASAGTKGLVAAGFMYGATQTTGLGKVLLSFLSLGSLTSAGFDLVQLFIEVPDVAQMQQTSASQTSQSRSVSASNNRSRTVSASASNNTSASSNSNSGRAKAVGGGNF